MKKHIRNISDITSNKTLLDLAKTIEAGTGVPIFIHEMPSGYVQMNINMAIHYDPGYRGFILYINPNVAPKEIFVCHELIHGIMILNGYPVLAITHPGLSAEIKYVIRTGFDLVSHVTLWQIEEKLGFSEREYYNYKIPEFLNELKNNQVFPDFHPKVREDAVFRSLLNCVVSPASESVKIEAEKMAENYLGEKYQEFINCKVLLSSQEPSRLSPACVVGQILSALHIPPQIYMLVPLFSRQNLQT